jgi:UDP-2,3-diacylglucosamine pyrophosphatase LpxH
VREANVNARETPGGRCARSQRAIFVSDVHLGAPGVQAGRFLEFLKMVSCDRLYLIGDIVDFWQMRRRFHWEPLHGAVLGELLLLSKRGIQVTYVPGNHDWFMRAYPALEVGGVEVVREAIHEAADGRRFLVVHGDEFDDAGRAATLFADCIGGMLHLASRATNRARGALGLDYFPLFSRIRHGMQHLVPHVARFESAAAGRARDEGLAGVICGHLHISALKTVGGVLYGNTGDWVDSCTAIQEDHTGRLALVDWTSGGPVRSREVARGRRYSRSPIRTVTRPSWPATTSTSACPSSSFIGASILT